MTPDALAIAKEVRRHLLELTKAMNMADHDREESYGTEGPKVMVQYALRGIEDLCDVLDLG